MNKIRLSPTRANDFARCPQLYKYRVIDQLSEPISLDAERGTLVHSVLEVLFDFPASERNLQTALGALSTEWEKQSESNAELANLVPDSKEWLDRAAALLENYFILEDPNSFEPTHRELHVEMDLNESVYLHGYIDRLDIASTGEVRIVDYKTGKAPKAPWQEKALFQLKVYALIHWRTTGYLPRKLQIIYLGSAEVIRSSPTIAQLETTERELLRIANEISSASESELWPARVSRLCDWCSFKAICPAFAD